MLLQTDSRGWLARIRKTYASKSSTPFHRFRVRHCECVVREMASGNYA